LLALAGVFMGHKAGQLANPWWYWVLVGPVIMLTMLATAACTTLLDGLGPLVFITAGRARYLVLALAITLGLTTPLSRLPHLVERVVVCTLMVLFVGFFAILPFLAPALVRNDLGHIMTRIDGNGVCFQSRSYTCGPAAAVTALARFGVSAEEGEIARLARANPFSGTLLWTLHSALKERYSDQGLSTEFRRFNNAGELRGIGVTLVSVREAAMLDHCVAVLDISDTEVTIADPLSGLEILPIEYFEGKWRRCGIVVSRHRSSAM